MSWLSLTLSVRPSLAADSKRGLVKILVPKKVAKLATRRNRIRRLIKEALRLEFSLAQDKSYAFRVVKDPGEIGLAQTKKMIHELLPAR